MTTPMQDLPPPGGFGPITYRRHLPKRGPPGWLLLTGGFGVIIGGLLLHAKGVRISKELDREKRQARMMLLPLFMAEGDLQYLEKVRKSHELEAKIMKDIPGWKVGEMPYHGDRFVRESILLSN